ncbi:MAG: AcrR family transcriptional regulator [Myxococcota bacterium]|jgi:AcrR family transcriptional regulator
MATPNTDSVSASGDLGGKPVKAKRPTRAERRRGIMMAAYRCFSETGYHGSTVDDICEAAGISKGTFYWYFSSKQQVFVDIIDGWADAVESQMKAQFRTAMSSGSPWAAMTLALEREAKRSRAIVPVWLEFLTEAGRNEDARQVLANFHRRLRRVLTELMELGLPDTASTEEVEALASSALAMFFGLLCQEMADPEGASFTGGMRGFMTVMDRALGDGEMSANRPETGEEI